MGKLKRILDKMIELEQVAFPKLLLSRIGLKAGISVNTITENSPDNPELEKKLLKAIKEVTGKEIVL